MSDELAAYAKASQLGDKIQRFLTSDQFHCSLLTTSPPLFYIPIPS
ncbi:hypothetical protein COLO4_12561 [Corchorus olitorius]|uniref:Uncharacterized protein n=1 Tax=Corchorus olitorius TaxID=93759 RepID=A0A1R3K0G0_9ROSI|nr:hypothetical protein COLO4_12561 [Corchorus olitorius]